MADREEGGYLFFLYQACNPQWILEFQFTPESPEEE